MKNEIKHYIYENNVKRHTLYICTKCIRHCIFVQCDTLLKYGSGRLLDDRPAEPVNLISKICGFRGDNGKSPEENFKQAKFIEYTYIP